MKLRNLILSFSLYSLINAQDLKIPADNKYYDVELTGDDLDELVVINEKNIKIYSKKVGLFSGKESYSQMSQFFIPEEIRNRLNGVVVKKNPETNLNELVLDIEYIYEPPTIVWNKKTKEFLMIPYGER